MRVIHWFRSDLRIADNTALAAACRRADALAPVFVLDDDLLARHRDAHPRLRFLIDELVWREFYHTTIRRPSSTMRASVRSRSHGSTRCATAVGSEWRVNCPANSMRRRLATLCAVVPSRPN